MAIEKYAATEDFRSAPQTNSTKALSVQGLELCFGRQKVLRDVSLELEDGHYACLLGASGSGKSTLLAAIAGLLKPQSGSIHLHGEAVFTAKQRAVSPEQRGIGMVFQDAALWPHLRIIDNVLFPLRARRLPVDRDRAISLLEKMNIPASATTRKPHELSGGQRQRVAIVRAIIARPRLVLLDEPLSAVDQGVREEIRHFLRTLFAEEGIAALHVTHDPSEAFYLGQHVGVLHNGRLEQWDQPENLYRFPASANVARLSGPVRSLPITVRAYKNGIAEVFAEQQSLQVPAAADLRAGASGLLLLRPGDIDCSSPDGAFTAQVTHAHWSEGRYLVQMNTPDGHELLSYSSNGNLGPRRWGLVRNHGWCIPAETSTTQEKTA
ncbi:MAG: ABC transporter ATP-binding protein [Acidithiobacillus sp.]